MEFAVYAPSEAPTTYQQRDALRKALGRALRWARAGRLDDEPLLEACLNDWRYDAQLENSRGAWLGSIIQSNGAVDRFRMPILHALYDLNDRRVADQLCGLAGHYAGLGDETFRRRLYEIVERKPFADAFWLGEDEIVGLECEAGFLFAAKARGKRLTDREWDWDDGSFVENAIERFGVDRIEYLLNESKDASIAAYRDARRWENEAQANRESRVSRPEEMRAISVDQIIEASRSNGSYGMFRGWGLNVEESDLLKVLHHLHIAGDPMVVNNLLKVFPRRAFPEIDSRVIDHCEHDDPRVRRQALYELQNIEHPFIRYYAHS